MLVADFNMEKALEGAFSKDYVLFIYFIYDFYNYKDKLIECSLSSLEYALFMYLHILKVSMTKLENPTL